MTNAFQSKSSINPLRRNRSPGESELLVLFQLLGEAALLVDIERDVVVQATPSFLQLTAFALNEVQSRAPREFFPDLPPQAMAGDEPFHTLLERRGRPPMAISVVPRSLDAAGGWRVLVCRPQEDARRAKQLQMERFRDGLSKINHLPLVREPQAWHEVLQRAAGIIQAVFEADLAGIYRMDPATMQLVKVAGSGEGDILPSMIHSADLVRLNQPLSWKPGRRVQTELHRQARMQEISFLASAPMEPQGMLVVAARHQDPPDHPEETLVVFAERLGHYLRTSDQLTEMVSRLAEVEQGLKIWKQAVESAGEGILLLGPDLAVRQMNPAAEWMLGYTSWEVHGQAVENILIGPEGLVPALQEALDGMPTHNMGVVSLHRRSGQSFPAEVQVIPVYEQENLRSGTPLAVMIGFRDVSEHEEIRQRTQQLEQRAILGEVTAVFAHEVRNPINNISTGLQLLSVKLPENDPNQENIGRLVNDCQRLNHLMESVLNFSRQVEHKFEEVDLEMLLRRMLDRWRPRMTKVNVTWFFHCTEGTPHVLGDPRSLDQVFTNLISNAVEAMSDRGGSLGVQISQYHQAPGRPQVEVTISDTGPGIPDEIRERIFEPFVTTKSQGTGLGLAITKRIITAHHGSVRLNTFPGGTVFHILLSAYQGEGT